MADENILEKLGEVEKNLIRSSILTALAFSLSDDGQGQDQHDFDISVRSNAMLIANYAIQNSLKDLSVFKFKEVAEAIEDSILAGVENSADQLNEFLHEAINRLEVVEDFGWWDLEYDFWELDHNDQPVRFGTVDYPTLYIERVYSWDTEKAGRAFKVFDISDGETETYHSQWEKAVGNGEIGYELIQEYASRFPDPVDANPKPIVEDSGEPLEHSEEYLVRLEDLVGKRISFKSKHDDRLYGIGKVTDFDPLDNSIRIFDDEFDVGFWIWEHEADNFVIRIENDGSL